MLLFRPLTFLSAVAIFALTTSPLIAANLSREQISQQIIGKTLAGMRMGMTVRITYLLDGTVQIKAPFMTGSGTWRYSEPGICMVINNGPRAGKSCIAFEPLGEDQYRNSEGMTLKVEN